MINHQSVLDIGYMLGTGPSHLSLLEHRFPSLSRSTSSFSQRNPEDTHTRALS